MPEAGLGGARPGKESSFCGVDAAGFAVDPSAARRAVGADGDGVPGHCAFAARTQEHGVAARGDARRARRCGEGRSGLSSAGTRSGPFGPGKAVGSRRGWEQQSAAGSIRAAGIAPQCPGSRDAASPQGPQADAGVTGSTTAAAAACVMRRAGLQRSQPRVRRATRAGGSVGGGSRGACEARVLAERSVTGAAAEEACCYAAG